MKIILISIVSLTLLSCAGVKQIGDLNMISTRNIPNDNNYVLLATYVGTEKNEIRKNKARTLDEAVDKVVSKRSGGEILKNVKVYLIGSSHLSVSGDVWGIEGKTGFKGFDKGEQVLFKQFNKYLEAEIISFVNSERVIIKYIDRNNKEITKEVVMSLIKKK
jgi:hypothetical protein